MNNIGVRKSNGNDRILSIIIPALNEEKTIGKVLDRLKRAMDRSAEDYEVIVVDDGSIDMTSKVAQRHRVKVIVKGSSPGYGSALKVGFSNAKGRFLAFLDADNTYPPEELPVMLKHAKCHSLVVGSRFSFKGSGMSLFRKLGNLLFAAAATFLTGKKITDLWSGMRVFDKSLLEILTDLPNDLTFTPTMTIKALLHGFSYKEVPISYGRRQGQSKLKEFRDGLRFLRAISITFLMSKDANQN